MYKEAKVGGRHEDWDDLHSAKEDNEKKTEVKLTRNIKMMKKTEVHKQGGVIIMENEGW